MTPEWVQKNVASLTPESARFILEYWVYNKKDPDADVVLALVERAKVGNPNWKPPTRQDIDAREHPLPKVEAESDSCQLLPPAEGAREPGEDREEIDFSKIEEREFEVEDKDED